MEHGAAVSSVNHKPFSWPWWKGSPGQIPIVILGLMIFFGKYSALFFIVISMCYKINFTPNTNTCFLSIKGNCYNQLNLLLIIN